MAPQVLWKETTNPHSGSACVRLKVAAYNSLVGVSPNGMMTNGQVYAHTNPDNGYVFTNTSNAQWYTACSDRPDSLVGWYKYAPQGGDKGKIEIIFHTSSAMGRLPASGGTSHWVGTGIIEFTSTQSTWKRFSFPINYLNGNTPNYFLIVAAAGFETSAVTGSELFLDDLQLIYNPPTPVGVDELTNHQNVYFFDKKIYFKDFDLISDDFEFNLYSLGGKTILQRQKFENIILISDEIINGLYIYQYRLNGKTFSGKIIIH